MWPFRRAQRVVWSTCGTVVLGRVRVEGGFLTRWQGRRLGGGGWGRGVAVRLGAAVGWGELVVEEVLGYRAAGVEVAELLQIGEGFAELVELGAHLGLELIT